MYKTVRHGENSLQYTILPQTEEVLTNSGLKGKGRDYSPSIHKRRTRNRPSLKHVLLISFGILVMVMLAVIPICVINGALRMHQALPNLRETVTTPTNHEIIKSIKKDGTESSAILSRLLASTAKTSVILEMTSSVAPTEDRITTPKWAMPALRSWKSSTSTTIPPLPTEDSIPFIGTPSGSIRLLDNYKLLKPWEQDIIIRPTVAPKPTTKQTGFSFHPQPPSPPIRPYEDVLITTKATTSRPTRTTESTTSQRNKFQDLKDTILSVDDDDDFKESLEVDEVFSLPPLKPESETDEVTVSKTNAAGWYGARWPFVDTSSYFQWTGYSSGDNLLLPLLVAALSSTALVLLLAFAVRRRKRSLSATNIGKLTVDLHVDDNTNLLADNAEDLEE